jgi:predicted RNase H-like HicB family nuclease
MTKHFTASVWQEDDWYIAQCLEVDIASQGKTRTEALANLVEALHLHFTPPVATITPDIASIEVELHAA